MKGILPRGGTLRTAAPTVGERLIYAVGDIHGRYDLMKALLARIAADARERARGRRPLIIFCGDYVDRGNDSNMVLEALVWLQSRQDVEVEMLKGNHEQALLAFLEAPASGRLWVRNGGDATLAAYGVAAPAPEDRRCGLYGSTGRLFGPDAGVTPAPA